MAVQHDVARRTKRLMATRIATNTGKYKFYYVQAVMKAYEKPAFFAQIFKQKETAAYYHYAECLIPSSAAAVPPRIACLSASLRPGVDST